MTRLPVETWDLRARTDLKPYPLNEVCPVCHRRPVENHHIVRRSFGGKDFTETWWIELPDGKVIPNRVGLCNLHHQAVTENRAQIVLEADGTFVYSDRVGSQALNPQPGPQKPVKGKPCTKCKGSGAEPPEKPKPEKNEAPRPKATVSFRVPKDDRENGHEIYTNLRDQCRDELKDVMGWKDDVPEYYVIIAVLYSWLSERRGEVAQ